VDATHETLQLQFANDAPVERGKVIALVQKRKNLRLAGPDRLRLEAKMAEWPLRVQAAKDLLGALAA
jgi:transcription-repair coupling factor (superfamily II helicase)